MAKTQWILLFSTFAISCASLLFIIVSFATNYWIVAEAEQTDASDTIRNSDINYGLFSGSLTRKILQSEANFNLKVVCLYERNVCIYSCQATAEQRQDEINRILNDNELFDCPVRKTIAAKSYSTRSNETIDWTKSLEQDPLMDAGLWLTSVLFLSITAAFAFLAATFAIINIVFNPVEPILSILGLYVWNGVASFSACLTLTLWGILFGVILSENVSITDTLNIKLSYSSDGLANLGYSYWIVCCPALLHIVNIGLLLWRKRIIEMEPPPPTMHVDKNDFTIMLY